MDYREICEKIKNLDLESTEIVAVEHITNGSVKLSEERTVNDMPDFTRVVLHATPSTSSNINIEVWLPDNFNDTLYISANGGMAGSMIYDGMIPFVRDGYAVAKTDMGTSGGVKRGVKNPELWKDFGWRSTCMEAEFGKKIASVYYGRENFKTYFLGISTGGQQAFCMLERKPELFDGIIVGAPANNRTHLHTYMLWNHVHLRTRDGKVMFSDEEIKNITATAIEFYQSKGDGEKGDNFITKPQQTPEIIEEFLKFLGNKFPCFTAQQIESLRAVYNGPVNPVTKKRIYCGVPMGSESNGGGISAWQESNPGLLFPFDWVYGEDYNYHDFDFNEDMEAFDKLVAKDFNAVSFNIDKFINKGGKLFIFAATGDPCVPFPDAIRVLKGIAKKYPNYEDFCRMYLVAGQDHAVNINRYGEALINGEHSVSWALPILDKWCRDKITPDFIDYKTSKDATDYRRMYPVNPDDYDDENLFVTHEDYLKF